MKKSVADEDGTFAGLFLALVAGPFTRRQARVIRLKMDEALQLGMGFTTRTAMIALGKLLMEKRIKSDDIPAWVAFTAISEASSSWPSTSPSVQIRGSRPSS